MSVRSYFWMVSHVPWRLSHLACLIRVDTSDSLVVFFRFLLKYSNKATIRLPMSDMSHSNFFWYHVFFSYLCHMKVLTTDFLVFFFLLKYSNSIMSRLPMSVLSHPNILFILFFLSHKHIPRNRTFSCLSYFCWHSHLPFSPDVDCSQPQTWSPPVAVRCHHSHRHRWHRHCRLRRHCCPQ